MILDEPQIALNLRLEGNITPKARPRVSRGSAYLPKRYREWKEQAISQLISQLPPTHKPLGKCAVAINLYGSLRGDLDNLAGAILDALVQSGAIKDDRLSVVRKLTVTHDKSKIKGAVVLVEKHARIYTH